MSSTTAVNSAVVIASEAKQSRRNEAKDRDRRPSTTLRTGYPRDDNFKPKVNVEILRKELQEKRKLLNLLEEKGITLPQIDKAAIDKALADLDGIIASSTVEV